MAVAVVLLTLALAAANGANDVSKGVATLAGTGVTPLPDRHRLGAATTLVGSLASFLFAERMAALFSRGIVTAPPTAPFALAVLVGAAFWVGLAAASGLPVHAIVGALVGAGRQLAPGAIEWAVLLSAVAAPLLVDEYPVVGRSRYPSPLLAPNADPRYIQLRRPVSPDGHASFGVAQDVPYVVPGQPGKRTAPAGDDPTRQAVPAAGRRKSCPPRSARPRNPANAKSVPPAQ